MFQAPLYPMRSPTPLEVAAASFFPNGSSAVVTATMQGFIVSVTRTGAGQFTVVIPDQGILVGAHAFLRSPAAGDIIAIITSYTSSTKSIAMQLFDVNTGAGTGAAVDVAADPNSQVLIVVYFQPNVTD